MPVTPTIARANRMYTTIEVKVPIMMLFLRYFLSFIKISFISGTATLPKKANRITPYGRIDFVISE